MCEPMQTKPRKAENENKKAPHTQLMYRNLVKKHPSLTAGHVYPLCYLAGLSLHSKAVEQWRWQTLQATESPCENTIIKFSMTCQ